MKTQEELVNSLIRASNRLVAFVEGPTPADTYPDDLPLREIPEYCAFYVALQRLRESQPKSR